MYVVTEDVEVLLKRWAKSKGFALPEHKYFTQLGARLAGLLLEQFPNKEVWVESYEDFQQRINQNLNGCLDVVSLDQVYVTNARHNLHMTRLVDNDLNDLGRGSRTSTKKLSQQISAIARKVGNRPVAIVDDGCWSSGTIAETVEQFQESGVNVPQVCVGLSTPVASEKFRSRFNGTVKFKPSWEVKNLFEWVCQRDFFPGVPLSGKLLGNSKGLAISPEVGASYLRPFGDPVHGASILEENAADFSRKCLDLSIDLWREIEKFSGKVVNVEDLSRVPRTLQNKKGRFVHLLEKSKKHIS